MDLPDSDIACAAKQLVFDVSPVFVANHCVRSYLFARELATAKPRSTDRLTGCACVDVKKVPFELG